MTRDMSKLGAKAVGKTKALGKILKGQTGILRHLADEHGQVSSLMKCIAASDDVDVRRDLFPEIRSKLLAHAQAEEAEFYPPLRTHPQLTNMVERSLQQHREVEQLLDELTGLDQSASTWKAAFLRLQHAVTEHVRLEEEQMFPLAKEAIGGDRLAQMLEHYEREHQLAQHRLG